MRPRELVGMFMVFPGFLLAGNVMNTLYLNSQGAVPHSPEHVAFVIAAVICVPWLGLKLLGLRV